MDIKKLIILIVLLAGLVFAGKYACDRWNQMNPEPEFIDYTGGYGYGYGPGYGKSGKAGKAGDEQAPE